MKHLFSLSRTTSSAPNINNTNMTHLTTAFWIKLKDEDHKVAVNPRYLPEHLKLESRVWQEMTRSEQEIVEEARALIRAWKEMKATEKEKNKEARPPMGAGGWRLDL